IVNRYLCNHCKVMSVESNTPVKRKPFSISTEGVIEPACPGCLTQSEIDVTAHLCFELWKNYIPGVSYATALIDCPFCNSVLKQGPPKTTTHQSIKFHSCFISYSSKDREFANRIYADLRKQGVPCWFAHEDLKIGDKFWGQIEESIKAREKFLLILSENSISSAWVEYEVECALEEER